MVDVGHPLWAAWATALLSPWYAAAWAEASARQRAWPGGAVGQSAHRNRRQPRPGGDWFVAPKHSRVTTLRAWPPWRRRSTSWERPTNETAVATSPGDGCAPEYPMHAAGLPQPRAPRPLRL